MEKKHIFISIFIWICQMLAMMWVAMEKCFWKYLLTSHEYIVLYIVQFVIDKCTYLCIYIGSFLFYIHGLEFVPCGYKLHTIRANDIDSTAMVSRRYSADREKKANETMANAYWQNGGWLCSVWNFENHLIAIICCCCCVQTMHLFSIIKKNFFCLWCFFFGRSTVHAWFMFSL